MSEMMDPSKMKVADLRTELQNLGLDTKGNKPALVERLKEALEGKAAEQDGLKATSAPVIEENDDKEAKKAAESEPQPTQAKKAAEAQPTPKKSQEARPAQVKKTPDAQPAKSKKGPESLCTPSKTVPEAVSTPGKKAPVKKALESRPTPAKKITEAQNTPGKNLSEAQSSPSKTEAQSPAKNMVAAQASPVKKAKAQSSPSKKDQESSSVKRREPESREAVIKDDPDASSKSGFEEAPVDDIDVKTEQDNGLEVEVKEELTEVKEELKEEPMESEETEAVRRGEKRGRSRSRSPDAAPEAKRYRPEVEELRVEDEPDMDKTVVALDWYNSDLSVIISKEDYLSAQPLTMQGFGYVWHGVRATYGFTHGRVFYEAKVEDYLPVPQLEEEEQHPHVLRVGWSVNDAGLTLGEDPLSYGYGGTGKASTNLRFKDYGKQFGKGDVVGCFLDLEAEPIVMSFTVNGEHQGIAYEIHHADLGDQALFPHVVTKNASFKVNFGTEGPWFEPLTGYTFAGHVPLEERVLGSQNPEKREDAEVIMMVGLPAAGKTTWVEQYCKENVDKKYNVLGTNFLIDKMKVNGLPRRRNYAGRWEVLIERCTKCLNKLLELSYKRRRNFIIDQTNVYPSAQRRKMKGFAGFKRRAVVICPTDEDLKKRTEKRENEEGKDVPDKAVLEMKANFKLPEEGDLFDSVEFVELQREESQKLVEQYNKEGEAAGFGQKKGFRGGFGDRRGGFMDRRGGYGNRGNSFRGGWDRDRRGGYNDRRERSSWNRDRDSRDYNRGGYNRDSRGSYNRDYNRGSYNRDSRGSYNRDRGGRTGNYQSNWNRNSSNEIKSTSTSTTTTSTNPWATQQGTQESQGYGSYSNYSNPNWSNPSYGYNQGYNGWNQQYYQQQHQTQPQQYWGTGYNYGSQGYGTTQPYGTSGTTSQSSGTTGSWGGQSSSWSGTGQQQWGSTYNKQQWGTGYGSGSQSSQRR